MTTIDELLAREPTGWPADAEGQELVGDWRMYQRKRGHRASTDDVVTAWLGARLAPAGVSRYLDLGCGVGSVLLLVAHRLRPTFSRGVEAQAESVLLARRSVSELPTPPAITIDHLDFREVTADAIGTYDLVTGSPPYFPLGTGVLSDDAQRRACRFELRGGVEAYCEAASRVLAPTGVFAVVFPTDGDARVLAAARAKDLHLRRRVDLFMRRGRPRPFLTVYGFARAEGALDASSFSIRSETGEVTAEYAAARAELGLR